MWETYELTDPHQAWMTLAAISVTQDLREPRGQTPTKPLASEASMSQEKPHSPQGSRTHGGPKSSPDDHARSRTS